VFNVLSALQSSPIEQPLFTPSAADIFELHQAIYRVLSGLLRHRIDALEHMLPLVANAVSGTCAFAAIFNFFLILLFS